MAFSFRTSKKIGPFRIGISKSGLSTSIGVKGLRVGANSKGTFATVGIPKTGISKTSYAKKAKNDTAPALSPVKPSKPVRTSPAQPVRWGKVILFSLIGLIGLFLLPVLLYFWFIIIPGLLVWLVFKRLRKAK